MKRIIRVLLNFVSNVIGLLESFFIRLLFGRFTYGKRKTIQSKPVAIIANGPTLMDELDMMKEYENIEYCMLNFSAATDLFRQYKPKYYILADPLFFAKQLREEEVLFWNDFAKVDWKVTLYVPVGNYKQTKRMLLKNANISVEKMPTSLSGMVTNKRLRNYFFRHKMAVPPLQNVVVGAIYALIMEGYTRINLLGVGHSWLSALTVNDKNEVCLRDTHYYNQDAQMKPWYMVTGEPYKMHIVLRHLAQMFDSYHQLRNFADSLGGVRIVNYTKGSYIDAFERH